MRISDWSSDVCSSDLFEFGGRLLVGHWPGDHDLLDLGARALRLVADHRHVDRHLAPAIDGIARLDDLGLDDGAAFLLRGQVGARQKDHADGEAVRSEEHTSELQSLLRSSYAL